MQIVTDRPRVVAVLGPTNTGKTHFAMERMLAHDSGIIGFPLRLLARENYERALAIKGRGQVALITGEEKILPKGARYFLCTAESMPLSRPVAFLALDEVQMCADPDRGHVFTERLLRARGKYETMFMGAETMRPLIKALVPETEFQSRPRMSTLSYVGPKKTARLPARSALVAFTAPDVYAIAELLRRQRGGAALVMGGLSPRTRNAQVAMYQDGEVDYMVATDAIGMGLNMDIDHVSFAATRKFDGRAHRTLGPAELGQIAGRAGRHMNDGSFGTTAEIGGLDEDVVHCIEEHEFEPLRRVYWRNWNREFRSVDALRRSLAAPPPAPGLIRAREADDERVLAALLADAETADLAADPDGVHLLWEVCRIPDFRKVMSDAHGRLLAAIFRHLRTGDGRIPTDWIAAQVSRLERLDGDIDTLTQRIAGVRTWTYVSFRADWLRDAAEWQDRTRTIEDRLSDALHERLTQRFVDRRTTALVRRLEAQGEILGAVQADGEVLVEGHPVGHLEGFRFVPDGVQGGPDHAVGARAIERAANLALRQEMENRVRQLSGAADEAFQWSTTTDGGPVVTWNGATVARLVAGKDRLHARAAVPATDLLSPAQRDVVTRRLDTWFAALVRADLAPLFTDPGGLPKGPARGILHQLREHMGSMPRSAAGEAIEALNRPSRQSLRKAGIHIGRESVYAPALLKPKAVALRGMLYDLHGGGGPTPLPGPGRMSVPLADDVPPAFYEAVGYRPLGPLAVRVDIVERIAARAWSLSKGGPFAAPAELMNLIGCGAEDLALILGRLGYRRQGSGETAVYRRQRPTAGRTGPKTPRQTREADPDSPFAKLGQLMGGSR